MGESIVSILFGNLFNAFVVIGAIILLIVIMIRIRRAYTFMGLLAMILFYAVFLDYIVPEVVNWLCGDSFIVESQTWVGAQVSLTNQQVGIYIIYQATSKPLVGLDSVMNSLMIMIGSVVLGMMIWKTLKRFRIKDEKYPSLKKPGEF